MTLVDLHSFHSDQDFESDLLIVGAGIAGLVLADALRGSGRHVDVLEAGGIVLEPESQSLYSADIVGIPHLGISEGRFRVYGGSSTRWGGQLLPLAPHDFYSRPHVSGSGWPINSSLLTPYLFRCEQLLGVNHAPFDSSLVDNLPRPGPTISEPGLQLRFSKWAPFRFRNVARNLGKRCQEHLHTRIFLHASATSIILHPDGHHAEGVTVRTLRGRCFHFRARQLVIAAGTIETTRLLLISRDVHRSGIGNHSSQLGLSFHDHLSVEAAILRPRNRRDFLERLAPWYLGTTRHTLKFETTLAWQMRHSCLNVMGHLVFRAPETSAFSFVRQHLLSRQSGVNVENFSSSPPFSDLPSELTDLAYLSWKRVFRHRRWCPAAAEITLCIDTEQQPNPESHLRLSSDLDSLGMAKVVLSWQWGESERHAFSTYRKLFNQQWLAWSSGDITWKYDFLPDSNWTEGVRDTYHLMGGTRMSSSPQHGVVDSQLRVHGLDNLFVASCSSFPTGGSSNPTLTLMQLTLRLADQLRFFSA